jgi:hypothetical protein
MLVMGPIQALDGVEVEFPSQALPRDRGMVSGQGQPSWRPGAESVTSVTMCCMYAISCGKVPAVEGIFKQFKLL